MNKIISTNRILIAAGGTGGHIFPALSIINQINLCKFIVITDQRGEGYFNDFLNKEKINLKIFVHKVSSPTDKTLIKKIKSFCQFSISLLKSISLIISNKPEIIVGFGGYPSVAPILAAKLFKIPSIIHEQNAIVGRANKFLQNVSSFIALSFIETKNINKNQNSIFTGNPTRKEFNYIKKLQYSPPKGIKKFQILIVGGSLGANFFSEQITTILCSLPKEIKRKLKIVQQVRKEDAKKVRDIYRAHQIDCEIDSFFQDIFIKYGKSHLIITRSGGSSVAEVLASIRPVIFVPLPTSLDNHQLENAKFIKNKGGGWILNQNNNIAKNLKDLIETLINKPSELVVASNRIKKLSIDLDGLRENKSATEFFSNVLLDIISSNRKETSKSC